MSTLESVPITREKLHVICETCVVEAKIHFVSGQQGFERFVRVECHGVQRMVRLTHFAVRVAEYARPDRISMLWCQLSDVCPDDELKHWLADIVRYADEARGVECPSPLDRDEYVRGCEELAEHVRVVMRSRCGERVS